MEVIYTIIILFSITTIMGLYLSSLVLRDKDPVRPVIAIHGVFTITGFVLLFLNYPGSHLAILTLAFATLFGLVLLFQDITGAKFSKWLCFAHGFTTLAGIAFLIVIATKK